MTIAISLLPSRTSGALPLAVFFDATGTTDDNAVSGRPFHDDLFVWRFGIADGTWGMTGLSKRIAFGPCAACVFETAGVYIVSLTVYNLTSGESKTAYQTITCQSLATAGIDAHYISINGDFTGAPAESGIVEWIDATGDDSAEFFDQCLESQAVFLQRGESWTHTTNTALTHSTCRLGAFGTASLAKPSVTGTKTLFTMSSSATPLIEDISVSDIAYNGSSTVGAYGINASAQTQGSGIGGGGVDNVTFLRLDFTAVDTVAGFFYDRLDALGGSHALWDGWCLQEITGRNVGPGAAGGNGIIGVGQRIAFLGNDIDLANDWAEFPLRFNFGYKGVVSHNKFANPRSGGKSAFHLRSINQGASGVLDAVGGVCKYIVGNFNILRGTNIAGSGPLMGMEGGNAPGDIPVIQDVLWEKNLQITGLQNGYLGKIAGSDVTVRNNISVLTTMTASSPAGYAIFRNGSAPVPTRVNIYNETIFSGKVGGAAPSPIIFSDANSVSCNVENVIAWADLCTSAIMLTVTAGGDVVSNRKMSNSEIIGVGPGFVGGDVAALNASISSLLSADAAASYASIADLFRISSAYVPAAGSAAVVPVVDDYVGRRRSAAGYGARSAISAAEPIVGAGVPGATAR